MSGLHAYTAGAMARRVQLAGALASALRACNAAGRLASAACSCAATSGVITATKAGTCTGAPSSDAAASPTSVSVTIGPDAASTKVWTYTPGETVTARVEAELVVKGDPPSRWIGGYLQPGRVLFIGDSVGVRKSEAAA